MEDGRGSSGIGRGKSIGLAEGILLPAEAVDSNRSRPKFKRIMEYRRFVASHLCHKSLMSQSVDDMSQNKIVTNHPSTKQNCDKSSI